MVSIAHKNKLSVPISTRFFIWSVFSVLRQRLMIFWLFHFATKRNG